jgi:hypothetical protein
VAVEEGIELFHALYEKDLFLHTVFENLFLGIENPEEVFLHEYYAAIIRRLF